MDALSVDETRREALKKFVGWCKDYITGDEKGEAQFFLDRLFQAFGQKGVREVGGTSEFRIRKPKEDGGGVAFADLVWKPIVLVEMKRRGEKLIRHYRQAFDYWARLVPDRPRYVVLCNFDEFWVYDFTKQMDTPVDCVSLAELPDRYGPLAFLFPTGEKPTFGNDVEAITRPVAEKLAECFNKLIVRKVDRSLAQRFVLQILVAFFSEDIGLLKKYFVAQLLDDCKSPTDSYDLLGGLFTEMNTPSVTAGGRFKGVDYFNGGLFAEPARLELYDDELNQLRTCAKCDWSKISPEIFGAIFQHSMDAKERRAFGAHFTTPEDIMKIVKPTIVAPWLELIENADTIRRLSQLRQRLEAFHVLDPACGSGNFLYIAYREMKRLEARIFERMNELSKRGYSQQKMIGFVTASQFHGIDINPFAIELAKVTMMIARKLAIDELHMNERALPLDNLDKNFIADDALVDSSGNPTRWPRADVIIGNPPFTGAKLLKPTRGADYVKMLRKAFPDVPGMADYCVYWIRQTHDRLPACTADDPVAGRAGLVGTQNIRNNKSREGGLDYVVRSGTVVEAVDNQPWSGEANVHVSIANWVKHDPIAPRLTGRERRNVEAQLLVPNKRKLWFNAESSRSHSKPRKRGSGPASKHKHYEPDYRECEHINSALSDQIDVSGALRLRCNYEPQVCFNGQFPRCKEFEITASQAKQMRKADSKNCEVVFPCLIGTDFLGGGCSKRWVIDFQKRTIVEAQAYGQPFQWVQERVLPYVEGYAIRERDKTGSETGQDQNWLATWWQHFRCRDEMVRSICGLTRYIACSDTTKRPVFAFVDSTIRPDHKLRVFSFGDDYSFGVLQSHCHWLWFITKCSKLTERFNYTSTSVFDTFPWPQCPTMKQIRGVAEAGREVRRIRDGALENVKGGLRAVYRTLELPGKNPLKDAHAALDAAVLEAYGFSPKKDLLSQILELNLDVASRIDAGEPVVSPGIPPNYPEPQRLITDDCIKAE